MTEVILHPSLNGALSRKSGEKGDSSFVSEDVASRSSGVISNGHKTSTASASMSLTHTTQSVDIIRPEYVDPVVAATEQMAVAWSRVVVIFVVLIAMIVMSSTMYNVVTESEKANFELQFNNYASEISSIAERNAKTTIAAVETFSATITSYASATNSTWPFVTIQDFPARASRLAELTNSGRITLAPVVQQEDAGGWYFHSKKDKVGTFREAIEFEQLNMTVESLLMQSSPVIFRPNWTDMTISREDRPAPWLVISQNYPLLEFGRPSTNYNILNGVRPNSTFLSVYNTKLPMIEFVVVPADEARGIEASTESQIMQPIFAKMDNTRNLKLQDRTVVGIVWLRLNWVSYFENLLPVGVEGIILVLSSTCIESDVFTYEINGLEATQLGNSDLHDTTYDSLGKSGPFVSIDYDKSSVPNGTCIPEIVISLYPSKKFEESFYTNEATRYVLGIVGIFLFASLVFGIYDFCVRRRQNKVMARIIRQDKIVSNMFPTAIKDRLYGNSKSNQNSKGLDLDGDFDDGDNSISDNQIAELYPCVTIVFADIMGFTAWSSAREPSQVFTLLESIYGAFDKIAYRHEVFKVETVGDCYVAVGGLPDSRDDHAVIVAKFARDCLHKMGELTRKLEVRLGPDTTDLGIRCGVHTGQVTAGVLRGERSRFQLFGETMNTCGRMETTAVRGKIQVSGATAEQLKKHNKYSWISAREDKIPVEGKGEIQTYWLETKEESRRKSNNKKLKAKSINKNVNSNIETVIADRTENGSVGTELDELDDLDDYDSDSDGHNKMTKKERLVEWNVEILSFLLKQILAARTGEESSSKDVSSTEAELRMGKNAATTVLDEFKEIITLPIVDSQKLQQRKDLQSIVLSQQLIVQIRNFVTCVANMYRPNAFHNFEHAAHVTASVRKLLTRIVRTDFTTDLASHSFGITSDPLTQFAVVFSAIIHDADHPGVPNVQLLKEETKKAQIYKKSIAEQNSVDIVWELLMGAEFADLRACIYSNKDELQRFRQLVVNTVMATDIADKELQTLRKARWATAFSEDHVDPTPELEVNRKATIVIEHLIQASDVSHTMQHWNIYLQWNERFFMECYDAYKVGRAGSDPSVGWYKGEIGFFDFYIIPLAKKLENCGVFGVSSYEYLNYAKSNREDWAREGERIVAGYLKKYYEEYPQREEEKS